MREFKDNEGRAWQIDVNVDARNQVKAALPVVDFYEVDCISKLADKETLGGVLYVLCREQIEKRNLTDREFFRAIKGDVWDGVMDALHTEMCDFFQSGERQVVKKALEKTKKLREMALAKATEVMEGTELEERLARTLNDWSTSSPAAW